MSTVESLLEDGKLADRIAEFLHKAEGKWPDEGTCAECHSIGMQAAIRGLRMMKKNDV